MKSIQTTPTGLSIAPESASLTHCHAIGHHLVEQRDRHGQRITLDLELENGERASLDKYVRGLLKSQSLEAWRSTPEELNQWLAGCVSNYIANAVKVRIWGHSN